MSARARAIDGYGRHACGELAAAIAYRILFSLVPFVALLAALLPENARVDVVAWLLDAFPGATVEQGVEQQLASAGTPTSLTGLIAFGTLIWTASGMTRSLRVALAVVWEVDARPAFVRAKLRDIAALGVLAALVLGVFALSLGTQIAVQAGVGITDALGLGGAAGVLTRVTELAVTAGATFAALLIVYRLAAPVATPLGRVWLSALVTAVAIDVGVAGLRVLPRPDRELRHHLRAAGRGARLPRPALHRGHARPLRRRADRGRAPAPRHPLRMMRRAPGAVRLAAMRLGASLFLIAVGAILYFAVTATLVGIDIQTVGLILMIIGVLGFVLSLVIGARTSRTTSERNYY